MTGRSAAHVSVLKIAAAAAVVLLLAAATVALLELGSALVHMVGGFFYVLSGGVG